MVKGSHASLETRQRLSKSHLGHVPWNKGKKNVYSEETLQKMSLSSMGQRAWNKGLKMSSDVKQKVSESVKKWLTIHDNPNIGRIHSEETRRKLSARMKGKRFPPEVYKKIATANRGKRRSEEFRKRMSEITQGNRNPMFGKKLSQEHKDKISEARLKMIIPYRDTSIEVKLQNALKQNEIAFSTHHPIFGQPDIFIEPDLCIFADGDYWHRRPEAIERDAKVNEVLTSHGYRILRFWEHEINKNTGECIQQICGVIAPKWTEVEVLHVGE